MLTPFPRQMLAELQTSLCRDVRSLLNLLWASLLFKQSQHITYIDRDQFVIRCFFTTAEGSRSIGDIRWASMDV